MFSYNAALPYLSSSFLPSYMRPFADNNMELFTGMTGLYLNLLRDLHQWSVSPGAWTGQRAVTPEPGWSEVDVTLTPVQDIDTLH